MSEYRYADEGLAKLYKELGDARDKIRVLAERKREIGSEISRIRKQIGRIMAIVNTGELNKPREEFHNAGCPRISSQETSEELILLVEYRGVPTYGRFPGLYENVYQCPECNAEITISYLE